MKADPRVDAFISAAAPFAQPLLKEMRARITKALPDAVETIKWRVPFYEVNGKIVASMAAFKAHTKFGVWLEMRPKMVDARTAADLPPAAVFAKELKAAAELARAAGATPRKSRTKKPASDKAPARKSPAKRKAPIRKSPVRKSPVRKSPVKRKAPAKKAAPKAAKRAK